MDNFFKEGQKMVCIHNHFPKEKRVYFEPHKPNVSEVYEVYLVLGAYLCFKDIKGLWHHSRFFPMFSRNFELTTIRPSVRSTYSERLYYEVVFKIDAREQLDY